MPIITTDKVLRPRSKNDYYPTPSGMVREVARQTILAPVDNILDPGAGEGVWGRVYKERFPSAHLTGVELRDLEKPEEYDDWFVTDYLEWETDKTFDLIVGNPPYSLAEPFVRKSMELLRPGGRIMFLLRLTFLASQTRYYGLYEDCGLHSVMVSSRRPSFTLDGRTDADDYAIFVWDKFPSKAFIGSWLMWEYDNEDLTNLEK